ncbi:GerAB/ArcD/ProY family transporter [Alkalihalobacillus alcalophilus]|uniref:GerAB/ArcD/ProY family transporter n=1 Tax=Alkalihalobacillus alcalophilus TaxID=1445 RepID=UPI00267C2917|nr:GerAB/ArcD/ProY family transporter [Alkalihalobacillus alcalophilus]
MEHRRDITLTQTIAILVSTIIGVGVLHIPLIAVRGAETAAPFVTLLGSLLTCLSLLVITKLGKWFPDRSIIHYSEIILGEWMGRVYSVLIICFFALLTGFASREFGMIVNSAVLIETPLEVVVLVMLILAAIFTRYDFNTFAYIHTFYIPIILAPALIIVILSLRNANPLYLQPVFHDNWSGTMMSMFTIAALFQSGFILTLIIPAMHKPEKAFKAVFFGIGITGGLYVLIVSAALAVFGPKELTHLSWPTLELARSTSLGQTFQRLDAIFLSVWVIAVFTTIFSTYMFTVQALTQLFRLKDQKMFTFFCCLFFL